MRESIALQDAPATAAAGTDAEFLLGLGKRARELREQRGMSRRILARAAGISERYLAQFESGEGNVSIILLRRTAAALGVALPEVLSGGPVEQRLIRGFLERLPRQRLEQVIWRLTRDFGSEETARKKRIALVGLRGAGKSTLGSMLAAKLELPFVELGKEVERETGIGLGEVFMLYGQSGYRRIERRCLEKILEQHDRAVISAGGGIVSEPETYELLRSKCFTVWLKTAPEEHMARVVAQGDFRPMQGSAEAMEDLRRILIAREPLCAKADAVVDTTGQVPKQSLGKLYQAVTA